MGSNKNRLPKQFDVDMEPLRDLMKQMDSFFNKSFKQINSYFDLKSFWIDMYETDSEVIVEAKLPGYRRDQIQLEIVGNQLRIIAEDVEFREAKNDKTKYYNSEQSFQRRERLVSLPFTISEKDTTASLDNGILKVSIPKLNSSRKFIDIDENK